MDNSEGVISRIDYHTPQTQLYQVVLGLEAPSRYVPRVEVKKDEEEIWSDLGVPPGAMFWGLLQDG